MQRCNNPSVALRLWTAGLLVSGAAAAHAQYNGPFYTWDGRNLAQHSVYDRPTADRLGFLVALDGGPQGLCGDYKTPDEAVAALKRAQTLEATFNKFFDTHHNDYATGKAPVARTGSFGLGPAGNAIARESAEQASGEIEGDVRGILLFGHSDLARKVSIYMNLARDASAGDPLALLDDVGRTLNVSLPGYIKAVYDAKARVTRLQALVNGDQTISNLAASIDSAKRDSEAGMQAVRQDFRSLPLSFQAFSSAPLLEPVEYPAWRPDTSHSVVWVYNYSPFNMATSLFSCLDGFYDLLRYFIPIVAGFDGRHRYAIGLELERQLYDVLRQLVAAAFARERQQSLQAANAGLAYARYLVRLCHDLNQLSSRQYGHVSEAFESVGSQIGGWMRHSEKTLPGLA